MGNIFVRYGEKLSTQREVQESSELSKDKVSIPIGSKFSYPLPLSPSFYQRYANDNKMKYFVRKYDLVCAALTLL